MADDTHVIDNGWDALPEYADKSGEADDAVTVSISTAPGEWLVNTVDSVVVPMSMAEVVDAMRAHKLTERSLVWRQGMQEWSHVDAVPQLKLAARMAPTPVRRHPQKPSGPPTRQAPPAPKTPLPSAGLSPRSTLPFGFTLQPGSRPAHAKPALPPSSSDPTPTDEPGVLAVYERPTATISFDLSPEQPVRAPPPQSIPQQPLTLAPTTSDSSPGSAPPPPNRYADLSVVAAADFRAVKRSSKRSVVVWSVLSAAAASLLTFWLARSEGVSAPQAVARPTEGGVALAAPAPVAAPVDAQTPPEPPPAANAPEPVASATAAVEPTKPIAVKAPRPVARRPKPQAVRAEPIDAETPSSGSSPSFGNAKSPSSEPNPYDVKLDDDVPSKEGPAAQGTGLDDTSNAEASAASKSPGF